MIKYDIVKNEYQGLYVVFITDLIHFNSKGIFKAPTRKECTEWLKEYKKELKI